MIIVRKHKDHYHIKSDSGKIKNKKTGMIHSEAIDYKEHISDYVEVVGNE